jgi:hypothetical protein
MESRAAVHTRGWKGREQRMGRKGREREPLLVAGGSGDDDCDEGGGDDGCGCSGEYGDTAVVKSPDPRETRCGYWGEMREACGCWGGFMILSDTIGGPR